MTSHETEIAAQPKFPHESIEASEGLGSPLQVSTTEMPWLTHETELSAAVVTMKDETCPQFIVASAIGTDDRLVDAARGMTDGQRTNTDNMFWSRIGGFVRDGYHSRIETMPDTSTEHPVHVMRNNGGQRVYFTTRREDNGMLAVVRLAACDKNKQGKVMKVLSSASEGANRQKMSGSK